MNDIINSILKINRLSAIALLSLLSLLAGCSKSSGPQSEQAGSGVQARSGSVSMNKDDYPVLPNADAGADPAVSAEQGGKGFTGEGWETNQNFDFIGDPRALKGGLFRDYTIDFPATLRVEGPEANTATLSEINSLVYETLLGLHPTTEEYVPSLATHWKVSPDKMTYWFRLNPNARFSDGTPVTTDDVVRTFDFMMDPTLQAPTNQMTFGKMERPVAESKYIIRLKTKELNWRNFLYFTASMVILPGHILKDINGEKYIKDFNYKMLPGTGPYIIPEADVEKGKSITLRRRKDYWAEKARANVGLYNFDAYRISIVRDQNLAFEIFKKGELDTFSSLTSRQWVQDLNFDTVNRGLIQKRRVFNAAPRGTAGFSFNTRRAPFNDIRVRKALSLLINRKQMIEKIMFNQVEPMNSYFSGSKYENPSNPKNEFDPQTAARLLAEAGWDKRDNQGRLVKNGVPLQVELIYDAPTLEPQLTVYQEDLRRSGITLNLRQITFETRVQLLQSRKFDMALSAYTGLQFPNPETSWHSSLADQENNNNITGFKNARVDQICAAYDKMFDINERVNAIREIDGIVTNAYHTALLWGAGYTRLLYWNKFGFPKGYFPRTGGSPAYYWWYEPEKESALNRALKDSSVKFDLGQTDDKYWIEFAQQQESASSGARRVQ